MTLILAAVCEDDICVCADTRYVDNKWVDGFKDGFDKIYKFKTFPIIIFNHAVNKFSEKYWTEFCLDYDMSGKWKGKTLDLISEDFKDYIEPIVKQQLNLNMKQEPTNSDVRKSGFVVCGKNIQNNELEMYEFFWNPLPELPEMFPWRGIRLNGFGTGYDAYLKNELNREPDKFVNWNTFSKGLVKSELERLFSTARERKNRKGGKEFSDDFKIKFVMK